MGWFQRAVRALKDAFPELGLLLNDVAQIYT